MNKQNRRNTDIFSLAFLDIIACGFGAIVLLLLIVKPDLPSINLFSEDSLFKELFTLKEEKKPLQKIINDLDLEINQLTEELNAKNEEQLELIQETDSVRRQNILIKDIDNNLTATKQSLTEDMKRILDQERDEEVGGIPVDSEYIIFVIDNSGTMIPAWPQLLNEMENILKIHPKIKGIQVMNDQGAYLFNGISGRGSWIPDTETYRQNIIKLLGNQDRLGYSLSNPVKGLRTAIANHYIPGRKVSIYLMGDDITTGDGRIDSTLKQIEDLNTDKISNTKKVRIHGIVFVTGSRTATKYSQFIRQLSLKNEGTSMWVNIPGNSGLVDCTIGVDCNFNSD